jgi:hypothetical protein
MLSVKGTLRGYLVTRCPVDLVDAALDNYEVAKQALFLEDWRKAQSHVGLFCEAACRICRHIVTGAHTAIGDAGFKVEDECNQTMKMPKNKEVDEPFRVLIPLAVKAAYSIRNRRGVDHLSSIQPNHTDAKVQIGLADWILAELTRLSATHDFAHAQRIIDALVERQIPLLERINGAWKILDPSMGLDDMILLVSYHDSDITQADLVRITGK